MEIRNIEELLDDIKNLMDVTKENRQTVLESLKLEEGTFVPDEIPADQFRKLLVLYRKNKNSLDYIFYVNLKNIFKRHRKPYTRSLITFIQIFEECFPSALNIKFKDIKDLDIKNFRNRIRGYEKKLSPEIADFINNLPLKF